MSRNIYYIINILFCLQLNAQEPSDLFQNESSIEKLSKGNLLVRLESKDKKIEFLKKEMIATDCNTKCKKKLEAQIRDIIQERDRFNLQFIESFKNYFNFCPVYFYYDKDHKELVQSSFNGNYFLDDKLNTINMNTINKDSILILKKDVTPESENDGWLFQTTDGITLKYGFPYITMNNAKTLWTMLSSSDHLEQNCNYLVEKLNKNLIYYYANKVEMSYEGDAAPAALKGLDGYYITNKFDTIQVKIDLPWRNSSFEIDYEKLQSEVNCFDSKRHKVTLTPKMIKEFGFKYGLEKIRMISIHEKILSYRNENRFLQLQTDGKLNLYYEYEIEFRNFEPYTTLNTPASIPLSFGESHSTAHTQFVRHYALKLGDKPLLRFKKLSFSKDLIDYLKDCPELTQKIKDKKYDREDTLKIVNEYNSNCGK